MAEDLLPWAASLGITDASLPSSSAQKDRSLGRSLTVSTFPSFGGRGLGAARDLKEGEIILVVPKSALLSLDSTKADDNFATALQHHLTLSAEQVLSAYILREVGKGRTSRWYPYLAHLPRYHHTLAYFSEFEAKALQVEDAVWIAERAAKRMHSDWEEARPMLVELGLKSRLCTFRAWLWASATVSSRTVHVPWDNAGALCPIGDLFNYAPPPMFSVESRTNSSFDSSEKTVDFHRFSMDDVVSHESAQCDTKAIDDTGFNAHFQNRFTDGMYVPELSSYCFYARKDYTVGEQVLLCYGSYNNLELLEHYGFLLPYNPSDEVCMILPRSQDSILSNLGLRSAKGQGNGFYIQVNGRPSFSLLKALRLHFVSHDICKCRGYLALSGMQITVESDLAAYDWLLVRCKEMIACLPTTLEGDVILLKLIGICRSWDSWGKLAAVGSMDDGKVLEGQVTWEVLRDSVCGMPSLSIREQQDILDELNSFLQFHNTSIKKGSKDHSDLWLERWRLSVEWRLGYKSILHRCINFCSEQLQHLS